MAKFDLDIPAMENCNNCAFSAQSKLFPTTQETPQVFFQLDHGPQCMREHGREHVCLSRGAQFNRGDVSAGDM